MKTGRLLSSTDGSGRTVTYGYDLAGQVSTRTYTRAGSPSQTVTSHYDGNGRVIGVTDPSTGGTTMTSASFDVAGNPTSITEPNGKVTSWTWDDAGRKATMVLPDTTVVSYGYDDDGLLTGVTHPGGSIAYGHDTFGRLATESLPGGVTRTHRWAGGRRSAFREDRVGSWKNYGLSYDGAGRLAQVLLGASTGAGRHFDSTYDAAGQLVEWDHNGTVFSYGYDEVGNRTGVTSDAVSKTATFDAADQLVSSSQGTVGPLGPVGAQTFTYTHDAAGWLEAINRAGLPTGEFFAYDVRGRLNHHRGDWGPTQRWTTSRAYDGADRLIATTTATPAAGGVTGRPWPPPGVGSHRRGRPTRRIESSGAHPASRSADRRAARDRRHLTRAEVVDRH